MSHVRRKGEKGQYWMIDRKCIGRSCFAPGRFETRGASGAGMGTHATGHFSLRCMRNAYHGCPNDAEKLYSITLERERKTEGWKNC